VISNDDTEPSQYVRTYEGTIWGGIDEEADDQCPDDQELGTIRVHIVERDRAVNEGESLFEVMDCVSSETLELYEELVDSKTGYWKDQVEQLLDENRRSYPNFMLIECVELKPEYRGHEIGPGVVRRVIETLGASCELIACKPFPLQYSGYKSRPAEELQRADFEPTRKAAWKKVTKVWAKAGFVPVRATEYYIWPD
jgi:hypothetical protein